MSKFESYLTNGISFDEYHSTILDIIGKNDPSIPYFDYIKLNLQRMNRLIKTVSILPDLEMAINAVNSPQKWIVLSEAWCGDAAQSSPLFWKLASLNSNINLQFLWRDENLELMDQFLTDGKSRSIPKLIVLDEQGNLLYDWGPRPAELQKIYKDLSSKNTPFDEISEIIHKWYSIDKTQSTQNEILRLMLK